MKRMTTSREAGFSLLEALLAAALVLLITLGILPLFTHSIVQNVSGKASTVSANYARSSTEELNALPLDRNELRPELTEPSRVVCQDYTKEDGWEVIDPCRTDPDLTPNNVSWLRTTDVFQYSIREIYDGDTAAGDPTFNNPVPGYPAGASTDSFVHIRELMVVTEGQQTTDSPLGRGRRLDLVSLRGF